MCPTSPGPADDPRDDGNERARRSPRALAAGELTTLVLFDADPLATHPDRNVWEEALDQATSVIAFTDFVSRRSLAEHANVVFPAESYAEKEGTVTHPDGRAAAAFARRSAARARSRPQRLVLAELTRALGAAARDRLRGRW